MNDHDKAVLWQYVIDQRAAGTGYRTIMDHVADVAFNAGYLAGVADE